MRNREEDNPMRSVMEHLSERPPGVTNLTLNHIDRDVIALNMSTFFLLGK